MKRRNLTANTGALVLTTPGLAAMTECNVKGQACIKPGKALAL